MTTPSWLNSNTDLLGLLSVQILRQILKNVVPKTADALLKNTVNILYTDLNANFNTTLVATLNSNLNVDDPLFGQLLQRIRKLYQRPDELDQLSLGALDVGDLSAAEHHAVVVLVLGVVKLERVRLSRVVQLRGQNDEFHAT